MFLVVSILAFRFYTLNYYPDFASGVIKTDAIHTSYRADTLEGKTWELPDEYDNAGYFFAYQPIYFEKEKTLIITLRYNDSLLEKLKFNGSGEELPLFPSIYENESERVIPTKYEYGYAYGIYSYRRYVFENVSLANYEHLNLSVHLEENYEEAPLSILEIYDSKEPVKNYKLTGDDKKELK